MRDFKKYTSKKNYSDYYEEPESRREWLLVYFEKACAHLKEIKVIKYGKTAIEIIKPIGS
jgi:hypothetical protein